MRHATLVNLLCPGVVHPQVRYKELLGQVLQSNIRWLDLGCGHNVIRPWALVPGEEESAYTSAPSLSVGVDQDVSSLRTNRCIPLRVAAQMERLPFPENSFDLVTANMVLEHCENPYGLMSEVWRVLRPTGRFIVHTPNKYFPASMLSAVLPKRIKPALVEFLTHRSAKDVYPTYYRANTRVEITRCSETCGFRVEEFETLETLTVNSRHLVFLSNLILARLLRWKALRKLQADFLVTLRKPAINPAFRSGDTWSANGSAKAISTVA